jgi:hypothetical protein
MDPSEHRGVFSTTDHQQASDTYFLGWEFVKFSKSKQKVVV